MHMIRLIKCSDSHDLDKTAGEYRAHFNTRESCLGCLFVALCVFVDESEAFLQVQIFANFFLIRLLETSALINIPVAPHIRMTSANEIKLLFYFLS